MGWGAVPEIVMTEVGDLFPGLWPFGSRDMAHIAAGPYNRPPVMGLRDFDPSGQEDAG